MYYDEQHIKKWSRGMSIVVSYCYFQVFLCVLEADIGLVI